MRDFHFKSEIWEDALAKFRIFVCNIQLYYYFFFHISYFIAQDKYMIQHICLGYCLLSRTIQCNASKPLVLAPKFLKSFYPGRRYHPPLLRPCCPRILSHNSSSSFLELKSYISYFFLGTIQEIST